MQLLHHHAYVAEGDPESLDDFLGVVESMVSLTFRGHPDVWRGVFDTIGVDDVRGIMSFVSTKPVVADGKYIFLGFSFITVEAQNALLKILEDPLGGSRFFILTPSFHALLPTVRSRVMRFPHLFDAETNAHDKATEVFLHASPAHRLEVVAPLVSAKDKSAALYFLDALERAYETHDQDGRTEALEAILRARKSLRVRAPSVKLVLEHLALTLPIPERALISKP